MSIADPILAAHIERRNAQFTAEQSSAKADHYLPVLQERADAFAAHVASMTLAPSMIQWALGMRAKYKSEYVQVHHFIADWLTALLILRYGEEPDGAKTVDGVCWPVAFTDNDIARAAELHAGKNWPANVFTLLTVEA